MAGPGAITAVILLASKGTGGAFALPNQLALIALVTLVCFCVFIAASRLADLLGTTGQHVLSRMLGVVLSALAVQFVIDGVRALMQTPASL
jgi:multiple antibiotic resistance protein